MENFEEIEENYKREVELLDENFLNDFSNPEKNKDSKMIEKNYEKKLNLLIKQYGEEYNLYLEKQKKGLLFNQKKENLIDEEKEEEQEGFKIEGIYRVTPARFKLSFKENVEIRRDFFKFKFGIKKNNFFNKIVPRGGFLFYLRFKLFLKILFRQIFTFFSNQKNILLKKILFAGKRIKMLFIFLFTKFKDLFSAILQKIFKKKKIVEKEGEKSEDQQIIEKLLENKS